MKITSEVDKLLKKLNKGIVNIDESFLNCLIDLDYRLKKLEKYKNYEMYKKQGGEKMNKC